jgi:hypothetical protein
MREIGEDEMADYRQQEAEERYEKKQSKLLSSEMEKERRDPGYVSFLRDRD